MKYFKVYCLMLFMLSAISSSCSADDYEEDEGGARKPIPGRTYQYFNILVIGDSFSRDAFSYVPPVIESVGLDIIIDMEILYIGGRALNYHWDYIKNGTDGFILDKYTSETGVWISSSNTNGAEVIYSKKWDLVILQEGSNTTRSYEKTQPHIRSIADYIYAINTDTPIAFMLSPAKPDGSSAVYPYTSDEVWQMNATTTEQLLNNGEIDYIIPCGTGIQNARKTSLDNYGDFGHLSYDGNHLQEGLPCLIEAFTAAQTLFNIFKLNLSIQNCYLKITQDWVSKKRIPGRHGDVIEGNEEDYYFAKKSALLAVEHPFVISNPLLN